ncbi:unnamed protein product [Euphydryas editha]|uniref:Uncharacterized protein n=1 Tax=Euphydryas editha TaxID=104508 RepID=A0AAU9V059_EUPED|nr:unnamed protein product [Euphydryas editha]
MATDEDKCKLVKLLQEMEVPELKLPERCNGLIKEFREKYQSDVDDDDPSFEIYENPYVPDKKLLEENAKKLIELKAGSKREKKIGECVLGNLNSADPKRPWRTNSCKEKLLRVDVELKKHKEKANQAITPLEEDKMKSFVKECQEETLAVRPIGADRLREAIEEARKNLPNFQYRNAENTTATSILPNAQSLQIP